MKIEIEKITDLPRLIEILPQWRDLVGNRAHSRSVSTEPYWAMSWYRIHAGQYAIRAFATWHGDRLVALLPLALSSVTRRMTIAGDVLSDETHLLVDRVALSAIGAIVDAVACEPGVNSITLPLVRSQEILFSTTLRARFRVEPVATETAPCLTLHGLVERSISAKLLKDIRRNKRFLEAEDAVDFRVHSAPLTVSRNLTSLLILRETSLRAQGKWDAYHPATRDPTFEMFLQHCVAFQDPKSPAYVSQLIVGDTCAASALLLASGNRLLYYTVARDWRRALRGVGAINLLETIRWAVARGFEVFDFGVGNEGYKYRFGAEDDLRENYAIGA